MKTTENTVLITGGSAGIGFEIAKLFSENGNHVIIIGRDTERLKNAAAKLQNVTAIVCDVSKDDELDRLVSRVKQEFPTLNILINNAGRAIIYNILDDGARASLNAQDEMQTNYFSVLYLIEELLPSLKQQTASAIINVTSAVAIVPGNLATYSASKAALHSYTQSLRVRLEEQSSAVKVFELMPPLVNTELSESIGGVNGIHPSVVAEDLINSLAKDEYEIHVGQTQYIYDLYLKSPNEALKLMTQKR
jgi:Short-chain dehydrogenase involved in D-alanine esterification of lipoteichoic acid and wall teichoic acid (D-alanine transfer protein)